MHAEQLERRAERVGHGIAVSKRQRGADKTMEWTVDNPEEGSTTRMTFLRWEDIVSRAWVTGSLRFALKMTVVYWNYLWRLRWLDGWRLGKGPMIAMAYPPAFALVLPVLFGLPVTLVAWLLAPWWVAWPLGIAAGVVPARRQIARMRAFWLVQLFIYNDHIARNGMPADMSERIESFAQAIAAALDDDDDEVLLVAHSNGAILVIPILLRVLARRGRPLPDNFAVVTYGHCVPLLTGRRDAAWFHAMLHELAGHRFTWVDIGSPPDGAAFCQIDPLLPVATHGAIQLVLLSARFFRFCDSANYRLDYASKYEAHFDYLRCGDRVSPIDFPSLSSSGKRLAEAIADFRKIP